MQEGNPKPKVTLNLSTSSIEDQVALKTNRVTANPTSSSTVLNEIKNLVFRIPIPDLEQSTRQLSDKLLNIALQTNLAIPQTPELIRYRHELLNLLSILNYRFKSTAQPERMTFFFKYISEGTVMEMSDALSIIRQSFENGDQTNKTFLLLIAKASVSCGGTKLKWLLNHYDGIDANLFYPFLTLFTVLSFCARTFENLKDLFPPVFQSMESFIFKEITPTLPFTRLIPLLAMKARMIHSYSLAIDGGYQNKTLVPLVDTYLELFRLCPPEFHVLHDEISWSFVYFIGQRKEPGRLEKILDNIDKIVDYRITDPECFITRQTLVGKIYEFTSSHPKMDWKTLSVFIKFSLDYLFINEILYNQKFIKFSKFVSDLLSKFNTICPNFNYHFAFLFGINSIFKLVSKTVMGYVDNYDDNTNDMKKVQDMIVNAQLLFETCGKILECFAHVMNNLENCRNRQEKSQPVLRPNFPFNQLDSEFIINIYVESMFTLIRLRNMTNRCNFRFAGQRISKDIQANYKMLSIHLTFLKCYERIRNVISFIFQQYPKIFKQLHPLVISSIWSQFFTRFFSMKHIIIDAAFLRTFFNDMHSFSALFHTMTKFIVDEFKNPTLGSAVVRSAYSIFKKLNEGATNSKPEMPERYIKYITDDIQMIFNAFHTSIKMIPNISDTILFMTELVAFTNIYFKISSVISRFVSPEFVLQVTALLFDQSTSAKIYANYLDLVNKLSPKSAEHPNVIQALINGARYEPIKSLKAIMVITKRKKELMAGIDDRRRVTEISLKLLPDAKTEEKVFLLKIIKKYNMDPSIAPKASLFNSSMIVGTGKDKLEIPADQMFISIIHAIGDTPKDQGCWNSLSLLLNRVFETAIQSDDRSEIVVTKATEEVIIEEQVPEEQKTKENENKEEEVEIEPIEETKEDEEIKQKAEENESKEAEEPKQDEEESKQIIGEDEQNNNDHKEESEQIDENEENNIKEEEKENENNTEKSEVHETEEAKPTNSEPETVNEEHKTEEAPMKEEKLVYAFTEKYIVHNGECSKTSNLMKCCMIIATMYNQLGKRVVSVFNSLVNKHPDVPQILSYVVCALCTCSPNPKEDDMIKFLQRIQTKEYFNQFFEKCVYIISNYVNQNVICQINLATYLLSFVDLSLINSNIFVPFVINTISEAPIHINPNPFAEHHFAFAELTSFPAKFQFIIEKTEYVIENEQPKDHQPYLDGIITDQSYYGRIICAEFAHLFVTDEEVSALVEKLLNNDSNKNNASIFVPISIIFTAFRSVCEQYYDQVDALVESTLEDYDHLTPEEKKSLYMIMRPLIFTRPEEISKYQNVLIDCISEKNKDLTMYTDIFKIGYLKAKKKLQQSLSTYLVNHLKEDDILNLISWNEIQDQKIAAFGKWNNIYKYWSLIYQIMPNELTATTFNQFKSLAQGSQDSAQSLKVIEIFNILSRLLINPEVIGYLISSNHYTQVLNVLTDFYHRYNASLVKSDYEVFIDAISMANDSGMDYLKECLTNDIKCPIVCTAFSIPHAKTIREKLFTQSEFIENALVLDGKPTHNQQCIARIATYYEGIFKHQSLMNVVFNIIFSSITYDRFLFNNVQYYTEFVHDNLYKLPKEIVLNFVKEAVMNQSHLFSYLIEQIVKEICKTTSGYVIDDLIQIQFNDPIVHIQFVKCVAIPFLITHPDNVEIYLESIRPTFRVFIETILQLIIKFPGFKITSTKAIEYYGMAADNLERHICCEVWARSEQNGGFDAMLQKFINGLCIYLSSYQKTTCDLIRFPKDCVLNTVLEILYKAIIADQKCPPIVVALWTIIVNNLNMIPKPLNMLWLLFVRQALSLKPFAKKTQLLTLNPLIENLTELVISSPPPENKDHHAIIYFANFIIHSMNMILAEQQSSASKFIPPIIKCGIKLTEVYGPQVKVLHCFFKTMLDYSAKQTNNQPNEIAIFELFMGFIPKLVETAILYDKTIDLDPIAEMLINVAQSPTSASWPNALLVITHMASNGVCLEKISSLSKNIQSEDIFLRFFPVLWTSEIAPDLRLSKLLPFAIKMVNLESSDPQTVKFRINVIIECLFDYPFENTMDTIIQELSTPSHRFRNMFLRHFLSSDSLSHKTVYKLEEIFTNLNLISLIRDTVQLKDMQNTELREFFMKKTKRFNTVLNGFTKHMDTNVIKDGSQVLSEWNLVQSLSETFRDDYMNGMKPSRIKTYLSHMMYNDALNAASQDVTDIDFKLIQQLSLDHKLFSTKFMSRFAPELAKMPNLDLKYINDLSLCPLTLYSEQFAKYFVLSEVMKAIKMDKPVSHIFSHALSPKYPPFIHNAYNEVRKGVVTFLKGQLKPVYEGRHFKAYHKARRFAFIEARTPRLGLEEAIDSANDTFSSNKNLIICLASKVGSPDWNPIIYKVIMKGLDYRENHVSFMSTLIAMLKVNPKETIEEIVLTKLKPFNNIWGIQFIDLIKENEEYQKMLPYIHPSLYFALYGSKTPLPSDVEKYLKAIGQYLKAITENPFSDGIYNNRELEKELIDQVRNKKELNMNKEKTELNATYTVPLSHHCRNIQMPFVENEKIVNVSPVLRNIGDRYILFTIRCTNGKIIQYSLTPDEPIEKSFYILSHCINTRYKKFGDTSNRSQVVPVIPSVSVGRFKMSQTNARPLIKKCVIDELRNNERPICKSEVEFANKKTYLQWICIFAARYASLASMQIALAGSVPEPTEMLLDIDAASVSMKRIEKMDHHHLIRLCGRIGTFLNKHVIAGPFKAAIISSFLCFTYFRDEVLFYLQNTIENDNEKIKQIDSKMSDLSLAESEYDTVNKTLESLITQSVSTDDIFTLPWL